MFNATYLRSPCVQKDPISQQVIGSEDCLRLNIYRPKERKSRNRQNNPLPVLVFIHGGSFFLGTGNPSFYGPEFLMDTGEVIFVTIQYRLGVFGFLAANDESCKGNYGLKDQTMALLWIHENIRAFGGDPKRVTLMGQSAGAASTQYQMLSKRANGLFHRAIMASGSALAFWALNRHAEKQFREFAAIAGIAGAESKKPFTIVHQLRMKTAEELMDYQERIPLIHPVLPVFRPVVEGCWSGAFITKDPKDIWKSCRFEHRPFLIGVTGYEEGVIGNLYYDETKRQAVLANYKAFFSKALEIPPNALGPLMQYYFGGSPTQENAVNLLRARARIWDFPAYKTVDYFTRCADLQRTPVDQYHFNFTNPFSTALLTNPIPIMGRGASHTDDMLYLFPYSVFGSMVVRGVHENAMKDYWVRFIVDYVKYGRDSEQIVTRRCRHRDMQRGYCEYMDVQGGYSRTPSNFSVSVLNAIDWEMIKAHEQVERLMNCSKGCRRD